jgi:nucleotide-binding universal stress UspA family protein
VARIISVPEFILIKDASYLETHEVKDVGKAALDDAKLSIAAGVGILSASGLSVCSDVPDEEDRPYRVILNEAEKWHANLIVLGSHGWSGFDRVIMGSVSEAVAFQANCSVEVIRRADSEEQ